MKRFEADILSIDEDNDALVLAFGGKSEEGYVILSRGISHDDQDVALGHDVAHLEINDQIHSGYGAIEDVELASGVLRLTFNATRLDLDAGHSPMCITGKAVSENIGAIQTALARLMSPRNGKNDI